MSTRDSIPDMRAAVERLTDSERRIKSASSYVLTIGDVLDAEREVDAALASWKATVETECGSEREMLAWVQLQSARGAALKLRELLRR